jgi:hypothetical protein
MPFPRPRTGSGAAAGGCPAETHDVRNGDGSGCHDDGDRDESSRAVITAPAGGQLQARALIEVVVVEFVHPKDALGMCLARGDLFQVAKYPNRSAPGVIMMSRSASLPGVAANAYTVPGGTTSRSP